MLYGIIMSLQFINVNANKRFWFKVAKLKLFTIKMQFYFIIQIIRIMKG